jgi:hypothetical protein
MKGVGLQPVSTLTHIHPTAASFLVLMDPAMTGSIGLVTNSIFVIFYGWPGCKRPVVFTIALGGHSLIAILSWIDYSKTALLITTVTPTPLIRLKRWLWGIHLRWQIVC